MRRQPDDQVFSERRVRWVGLAGLAAGMLLPAVALGAGLFIHWLLRSLLGDVVAGLLGFGVMVALITSVSDYLFLGWFNRRLRDQLVERLRLAGLLTFSPQDPSVYYVGLAHPSRVSWRRWETDDEIGFLQVTFDGVRYIGDRLSFEVPFEDIEAVELVPMGYGFPSKIRRIRMEFAGEEPFAELLFTAREGDRLSSGNQVTHTLYLAIRQRWERRTGERLASEMETVEHLLSEDS